MKSTPRKNFRRKLTYYVLKNEEDLAYRLEFHTLRVRNKIVKKIISLSCCVTEFDF